MTVLAVRGMHSVFEASSGFRRILLWSAEIPDDCVKRDFTFPLRSRFIAVENSAQAAIRVIRCNCFSDSYSYETTIFPQKTPRRILNALLGETCRGTHAFRFNALWRFCSDFSAVLKSCRLQCVSFTPPVSGEIENVRTNYTITAFYLRHRTCAAQITNHKRWTSIFQLQYIVCILLEVALDWLD